MKPTEQAVRLSTPKIIRAPWRHNLPYHFTGFRLTEATRAALEARAKPSAPKETK